MMVSYWIAVCRGFLTMPLGIIALVVFILAAVAVVAYRVTSGIEGSLALSGVFTLSFLLASLTLEHRGEPQANGLLVAVFVGTSKTCFQRPESVKPTPL